MGSNLGFGASRDDPAWIHYCDQAGAAFVEWVRANIDANPSGWRDSCDFLASALAGVHSVDDIRPLNPADVQAWPGETLVTMADMSSVAIHLARIDHQLLLRQALRTGRVGTLATVIMLREHDPNGNDLSEPISAIMAGLSLAEKAGLASWGCAALLLLRFTAQGMSELASYADRAMARAQ